MDIQDRIIDKLDSIDAKLDAYTERLVVVEEKQRSMSGQIKLFLTLVIAGITTTLGTLFEYFKRS